MYTRYILIALACGIISFFVAKEKGKNPIAWFIYGLVFSFITIFVIAFIRKKRISQWSSNLILKPAEIFAGFFYALWPKGETWIHFWSGIIYLSSQIYFHDPGSFILCTHKIRLRLSLPRRKTCRCLALWPKCDKIGTRL